MKVEYPRYKEAETMVRTQIEARGIYDTKLMEVMSRIPRHLFVSGDRRDIAYGDFPISIGHDQTISQPYIVAFMTQALQLKGKEKVLEIGTGSGYQTVILSELCARVYTIERIKGLMKKAKILIQALGYTNIQFKYGDGNTGWEENAPYDRIIVTAAAPSIPKQLKAQLKNNGILVIPVGNYKTYQNLNVIRKMGDKYEITESIGCRFVPLVTN